MASQELSQWALDNFILPSGKLHNEDHAHLEFAAIGFLWTNAVNKRQMREIAGQAELAKPPQSMGTWGKVRWEQQTREFFGLIPDFIITIYAPYVLEINDSTFCALIEHELYHCAQAVDEFGAPKFTKEGLPRFAIKGHDVEEFVGVVKRYGVNASAGEIKALVEAAKRVPEVKGADISKACGTCALKLA